jgi:hypothetical protein
MYDQWAGGKLVHVTGLQRPGDGEDWEEGVHLKKRLQTLLTSKMVEKGGFWVAKHFKNWLLLTN